MTPLMIIIAVVALALGLAVIEIGRRRDSERRPRSVQRIPDWLKMLLAMLLLAVLAYGVIWFATQPGAFQ